MPATSETSRPPRRLRCAARPPPSPRWEATWRRLCASGGRCACFSPSTRTFSGAARRCSGCHSRTSRGAARCARDPSATKTRTTWTSTWTTTTTSLSRRTSRTRRRRRGGAAGRAAARTWARKATTRSTPACPTRSTRGRASSRVDCWGRSPCSAGGPSRRGPPRQAGSGATGSGLGSGSRAPPRRRPSWASPRGACPLPRRSARAHPEAPRTRRPRRLGWARPRGATGGEPSHRASRNERRGDDGASPLYGSCTEIKAYSCITIL
mmetsp:Transcript_8634/g.36122  ORF Transcript_8634/g.36122 Transcript_8634/m.36122 type:complete len:266 (+) Transcript_8634:218-1015(+)